MDKNIEVVDGNHVPEKQIVQVQIKCVMRMEIRLSCHCSMFSWHQIYATAYF